jgi:hypothetical protein
VVRWWSEPAAGDIVWCHFPDNITPHPKPRPALIVTVFDDHAPEFTVEVAYGTSQKTTSLHRGEFGIYQNQNASAYKAAGLSYDTKFNLGQTVELPFSTQWFSVPPGSLTQEPKLGLLHPSLMRALEAAYRAAHP